VAQHLFREGHFELATLFVKEASVAMPAAYQEPYVHMHGVLQQIKLRNLGKRVCVCVCERERERGRERAKRRCSEVLSVWQGISVRRSDPTRILALRPRPWAKLRACVCL
jgi:hypothetical protein